MKKIDEQYENYMLFAKKVFETARGGVEVLIPRPLVLDFKLDKITPQAMVKAGVVKDTGRRDGIKGKLYTWDKREGEPDLDTGRRIYKTIQSLKGITPKKEQKGTTEHDVVKESKKVKNIIIDSPPTLKAIEQIRNGQFDYENEGTLAFKKASKFWTPKHLSIIGGLPLTMPVTVKDIKIHGGDNMRFVCKEGVDDVIIRIRQEDTLIAEFNMPGGIDIEHVDDGVDVYLKIS